MPGALGAGSAWGVVAADCKHPATWHFARADLVRCRYLVASQASSKASTSDYLLGRFGFVLGNEGHAARQSTQCSAVICIT